MKINWYITVFLLSLIGSPASSADNHLIGPLFLTPEQRDQLDASGQVSPGLPEQVAPGSIRFNGSISRSSGQRTGWLNGKRLSRFIKPEDLGRLELADDKLLVERSDGTAILKAGDSLNIEGGATRRRAQ
ncbi:MAG: hypothetical protein ACRBC3_13870 [Burkholderiaceae bacterium]